jgi:hypothetical protein
MPFFLLLLHSHTASGNIWGYLLLYSKLKCFYIVARPRVLNAAKLFLYRFSPHNLLTLMPQFKLQT